MNQTKINDLCGAVLIGGKSKRMGSPKALIEVGGKKLAVRTAELLEQFTDSVFLSGRSDQENMFGKSVFPFVPDNYNNIGPIAGILSVFEYLNDPEKAVLMIATDLPYLDVSTLENLISSRNKNKMVTLFRQKTTGFLEPLCAIYEPGAYEMIYNSMKNGQFALHKMFSAKQMETVIFSHGRSLTNLNLPGQLSDLLD